MTTLIETTYHILRPTYGVETKHVMWPEQPGFQRIKALLSGLLWDDDWPHERSIEHVYIMGDTLTSPRRDMFVDELHHTRKDPPTLNAEATRLYRRNSIEQFKAVHGCALNREERDALPWIGDRAVVFDRKVWF